MEVSSSHSKQGRRSLRDEKVLAPQKEKTQSTRLSLLALNGRPDNIVRQQNSVTSIPSSKRQLTGSRSLSVIDTKVPAAFNSDLLARRANQRKPLQVETGLHSGAVGERRTIRKITDISELYILGKEVMPSFSRDMALKFAAPKCPAAVEACASAQRVVIKVRGKPGSFFGADDEKEWRGQAELVMNLPPCESIARVFEVLEDSKAYYVVTELVGGMDLHETLSETGLLPIEEVKEVLRKLLTAVADLHANGCIHKDLKLENVMLDRSPSRGSGKSGSQSPHSRKSSKGSSGSQVESVKVIDFDTVETWTSKSPRAKWVLGTDQYIAPEAYDGRYSPASDVFACGVIGYKLTTGKFPFHDSFFDDEAGENEAGSPKMQQIKQRLACFQVDFPKDVFQPEPGAKLLLARMLASKASHRPSAKDALADPWLSPPQVLQLPATPVGKQRNDIRRSTSIATMGRGIVGEGSKSKPKRKSTID